MSHSERAQDLQTDQQNAEAAPPLPHRGRARRFTSRKEAEQARERLHVDHIVPLEQFADLIGDYKFSKKSDWIRCQLVDEKGECHHLHGWGWIAQLLDGTEGYIGHDCAENHFEADPRFAALFAAASARVDREITIDLLVARLGALVLDPTIPPTLEAAMRRREGLYERIMALRNQIPEEVLETLRKRSKLQKLAVLVRILYVEWEENPKTNKKRQIVTSQEMPWGVLSALGALNVRDLSRVGGRLSEANAALIHAVASIEQPKDAMQKWAKALEYLRRVDRDLDEIEGLVASFCQLDNLKLLWLLTPNRTHQLALVRVALEFANGERVTDEQARAVREAWAQEIRDAHGDREFEIAG